MSELERRTTKRLIMRVPMRVRATWEEPQKERGVESLNISFRGTYFASEAEFRVGDKIEVTLRMPEVVVSGQKTEWCFMGRVAHVDPLRNGNSGIGVHFLYYSTQQGADGPTKSPKGNEASL